MLFRYFAGTANPYPIAVFRIALYSGIALHFAPSLLWMEENYRAASFRQQQWSETLYGILGVLPDWAPYVLATIFMLACLCGIAGVLPRTSAILALAGSYTFASFNSIHLQTLALSSIWAALPILAISGTGSEALSVRNLLRRPQVRRAKQWAIGILLLQVLIGFFFSGIEKLLTGWPATNEMHLIFNYPQGFVVRDWVYGVSLLQTVTVGFALSLATVVIELVNPFLLLWRRTRWFALVVFQCFFIGVIAALEVPPLFWFVYAAGAFLVLDDTDLNRFRAKAPGNEKQTPSEPVGA